MIGIRVHIDEPGRKILIVADGRLPSHERPAGTGRRGIIRYEPLCLFLSAAIN
jgi:hypothetical protein